MRDLVVLAIVLTSSLAGASCSVGGGAPPQPPGGGRGGGPAGPVPVTVASVVQKAVPVDIQVIGAVEASETVRVHAQITGALTSVNFTEGDDVTKGQVLFTLDRRPLEAALRQVEANLARDLAQAANARGQAGRYQDLAQRGIATKEQVDTTRTSAAAFDATVEADRAALEIAKVQLQYATIEAPLTGRTGALMVHPGNLVRANDIAPMVVINQISPISVSFGIPESQLGELKRYMQQGSIAVEARPPGEAAISDMGRIVFVDNAVDRSTGTIRIKGAFPNTTRRLWPGQFVNVTVTLTTIQDAITVPSLAVQVGPQGQYIYVVKPDMTVDLRPVSVLRSRGDETIIQSGVKPDETIVTDGQLRLTPGSRVSIKPAASQKAAS